MCGKGRAIKVRVCSRFFFIISYSLVTDPPPLQKKKKKQSPVVTQTIHFLKQIKFSSVVWAKDLQGFLRDSRGSEQISADIFNLLVFLVFCKACLGMGQSSPCVNSCYMIFDMRVVSCHGKLILFAKPLKNQAMV